MVPRKISSDVIACINDGMIKTIPSIMFVEGVPGDL